MHIPTTLLTAMALATPPQAPAPAPAVAAPAPVPVHAPALEGEINGTRKDLAAFLRRHRRALRLRFFDRWGDPDLPIHSFVSLLEQPPFREANGSRTCALHFTLFPF